MRATTRTTSLQRGYPVSKPLFAEPERELLWTPPFQAIILLWWYPRHTYRYFVKLYGTNTDLVCSGPLAWPSRSPFAEMASKLNLRRQELPVSENLLDGPSKLFAAARNHLDEVRKSEPRSSTLPKRPEGQELEDEMSTKRLSPTAEDGFGPRGGSLFKPPTDANIWCTVRQGILSNNGYGS